MVRLLEKAKPSQFKKILNKYWEDKIAVSWCVDDVIGRARAKKVKMSKEKARDILSAILSKHDCCYGITWDTIDFYIDDVINQ